MKIVDKKITILELNRMAKKTFGNLVKAVVDIERGIISIDGELHSDEEAMLLQNGSQQQNLWGINIYPEINGDDRIEFDSMINLRPMQNNLSRGVDDPKIRKKVLAIVKKLIQE